MLKKASKERKYFTVRADCAAECFLHSWCTHPLSLPNVLSNTGEEHGLFIDLCLDQQKSSYLHSRFDHKRMIDDQACKHDEIVYSS